jgi:type I restriction enzyme, R subunit
MTNHTPEYLESELPAIQLLQKLGYKYLNGSDSDSRESIKEVILKDRLEKALVRLNPWLNNNNLKNAIKQISHVASTSVMDANEQIHNLINNQTYTVKQTFKGREQHRSVTYVDFIHPEMNDFLVVNQMKYKGEGSNSIPDLVIYLNGLPLAVIECKSPKKETADEDAVEDLIYYQNNSKRLFEYNHICLGVSKYKAKYGAIGAKLNHYQVYKSDNGKEIQNLINEIPNNENVFQHHLHDTRTVSRQDILLYNLFEKSRFLDLIRNFIIYEIEEGQTIKKLPRYQQIRATNKTIKKLQTTNEGGVIWATQGSGKSLTMVFLAAKMVREENNFQNPTIIVMTDRIDLDNQIYQTFKRCGHKNAIQANSVSHLKKLLSDDYGKVVTTTIFKFVDVDEGTKLENLDLSKIETLSDKENLYVMVDEAHRSQYGPMAALVRKRLTNAKFIAFTGTPLSNDDKSTLGEFYGGQYLDTYTIKQSVEDGSTLPILYEDGLPELHIEKELMDAQFDRTFEGASDERKNALKQKASGLSKVMTAKQRIKRVSEHIVDHYKKYIHPSGLKSMIVCYNRESAITYKKTLDEMKAAGLHSFNSRVVMSLRSVKEDPKEYFDIATPSDQIKAAVEDFKLPFGDEKELSRGGKRQFNNDHFLIVSDMLLTGYDAPIVQAMYLDKILKEHNLLQAIARVNRTRTGKSAGLLVDYCGITKNLVDALRIFGGELEPADVMQNISEEISRLIRRYQELSAFFTTIKNDRKDERKLYITMAVEYLEPEDKRDEFKKLIKKFNSSMSIVLPNPKALEYIADFKLFNEIKIRASNLYDDPRIVVTKEENKKLQALIDEHLRATGITNLLEAPVSIIDPEAFQKELHGQMSDKSKELFMVNRIKHQIKVDIEKNPDFYKPLSLRLEELIKKRVDEQLSQLSYLEELELIQKEIQEKSQEAENLGFKTEREFAIFKTLETHIEGDAHTLTGILFKSLGDELKVNDWGKKDQVKKDMRRTIKELIKGKIKTDSTPQQLSQKIIEVLKKNQ